MMDDDSGQEPGIEEADNVNTSTGDTRPLQEKRGSYGTVDGDGDAQIREMGLGMGRTVLLMVGGVAGVGIIALPSALKNAGWIGILLIVVSEAACGYCGVLLGRCWSMLLERYPESRGHVRRPYPLIAEKAVGKRTGTMITVVIGASNFGVCVVNVLLVAENTQSLVQEAGVHVSLCYWLIVACVIITPVTWLDTPKDFWWVGVGGTLTTAAAFVLAFIAMCIELGDGRKGIPQSSPSAKGLFLAFGTVLYGTAAASYFPTIQHDMKKPEQFPRAAAYAYTVSTLLYLPIAIFGYYLYGRYLDENLLLNLPGGGLTIGAQILISAHALFGVFLNLNPVAQSVEDILGVGEGFNWKKCLLRTGFVLLVLLLAETVPRFGPMLNLIGSAFAFLALIAPPWFYLRLCSQQGTWTDRSLPLYIKVLCLEIALIGILLGAAATYSALLEILSPNTLVPPCFISTDIEIAHS